jgi:hypothetical protein
LDYYGLNASSFAENNRCATFQFHLLSGRNKPSLILSKILDVFPKLICIDFKRKVFLNHKNLIQNNLMSSKMCKFWYWSKKKAIVPLPICLLTLYTSHPNIISEIPFPRKKYNWFRSGRNWNDSWFFIKNLNNVLTSDKMLFLF